MVRQAMHRCRLGDAPEAEVVYQRDIYEFILPIAAAVAPSAR